MAAATFDSFTTPNERAISGAMAVVTHLLFFALLVFGVTWQKRQPEAMVVDLWNNLPPMAAPKAEPTPEVKPEPPAPKPEPEVKPEAKPVPKAEMKPAPKPEAKPTVKPDIALQDKKAKERKAAEEAQERKKREQEEALKKLAAQQTRETEAKAQAQSAAREKDDAQKKAAQQAASLDKERAEYIERIRAKIRKFIVEPPGITGNPEVQFEITVFADGNVPSVKTKKASGQSAWDNAVERAILRAQPLPVPPPDSPLAKDFRELSPVFRLKE